MPPRLPYYIIESGRPGYVVIDMNKNVQFAELKKLEATRSLPKPVTANIVPRAELHATRDMLIEDYYDLEGGVSKQRFKEELIVAQADDRGRIFIDKDKIEIARKILREIRVLDHTIKLDPMGMMLPEESEEIEKPRNLGGRPRKFQ